MFGKKEIKACEKAYAELFAKYILLAGEIDELKFRENIYIEQNEKLLKIIEERIK